MSPTHTRAVVLIIDALRFDFLSPNPPEPSSPYHHHILSLPAEITARQPQHSFLFNAYADPPTTTLQRIKGLTTGTLPTFVDLGNNFGGSSIEEDSIIQQLGKAGKKVAFMGDDTWMSVFPTSFDPSMRHPYDSFNVEDLHTVDNGVITNLFPLLRNGSKPFDFLIGHFLGVDHVGHRVGPDHPKMKEKLNQMNEVLTDVVDLLDDDTLLVVLGDHGMDRSGDHGGDGVLETSSAMWIYSKTRPLSIQKHSPPSGLLKYETYPGTSTPWRRIQQIDIVPTLSVLLGLPIPFNNLGTVIPELFWRDKNGKDYHHALELNSLQIQSYLGAYRASPSGHELDGSWAELQSAWAATQSPVSIADEKLLRFSHYNQVALVACRSMWAQFNPLLMALGLATLTVASIASLVVYMALSNLGDSEWEPWLQAILRRCIRSAAGGSTLGFLTFLAFESFLEELDPLNAVLFGATLGTCLWVVFTSASTVIMPFKWSFLCSVPVLVLTLHGISFFSNSFTFWEGRIVHYFLLSSIVPYAFIGLKASTSRLRKRILGYSLLFAVCIRLMAISTVCREEQQPYCHVTFYASSSLPEPPWVILFTALPMTLALPWAVKRIMRTSKSDSGAAGIFLPYIFAPSLLGSTLFWFMEWVDSKEALGKDPTLDLRASRTWIGRGTVIWTVLCGLGLFLFRPLCLDIHVSPSPSKDGKKQVTVLGFANSFGAPYVLFWCILFAVIYLSMQLTAQVVMGLAFVAMLSFLEVIDSCRDAVMFEELFTIQPSALLNHDPSTQRSWPLRFSDVLVFSLMGLHLFYTTGHEATISSIQWKAAFILTPTVEYPWAPMTAIFNSFGPLFLFGLATPLLAMWNRSPNVPPSSPQKNSQQGKSTASPPPQSAESDSQMQKESLQAGMGMMFYHGLLLLGSAASSALLRRHLMVWKVFAPRFMLAAVSVLAVDVGVVLGNWIGVERIRRAIIQVFGSTLSG